MSGVLSNSFRVITRTVSLIGKLGKSRIILFKLTLKANLQTKT
ncbi:hypothetical protein R6G86_06480 [Actinotignum urinale]|uniref:Uncharacterized protein n=1 Tax=Actinotignum urinale TaxID=190146 RepID=A0ABU5G7R7_9ACTO|nr:hypothetical protein [Actinotignum urinale]MDY5133380.1 hypothetical protein [Actinotignum urinale]